MNIYICFQIVAMDILHCPDSLSYIRRVTISTIIQTVKISKGSYLNTYILIKMYVQENDNSWKKLKIQKDNYKKEFEYIFN